MAVAFVSEREFNAQVRARVECAVCAFAELFDES
jgi:hypothetical protein